MNDDDGVLLTVYTFVNGAIKYVRDSIIIIYFNVQKAIKCSFGCSF